MNARHSNSITLSPVAVIVRHKQFIERRRLVVRRPELTGNEKGESSDFETRWIVKYKFATRESNQAYDLTSLYYTHSHLYSEF